MPWDYGDSSGIVNKWADKYDIEIDVVQINDYIESINQYTAGQFDACTMTNMDALTIPSASFVDTTALIVGDFSNGNDGIVLKNKTSFKDIKGQQVNLVELSVSHYLLARGLESIGMT
jgi:NitT/TauT family transport system substrate-binding protein